MKTFWVLISYPTVNDTEIDKRYETFRVARNRERERERGRERKRQAVSQMFMFGSKFFAY
jgi:hypothetical protein